jgi:3-deoxy-D-manno-octulosonic-acid transferase
MREGDLITALPLDTPRRVKFFLSTTAVHVKFFATCKYEVWPELMKQLEAAETPSFVFATYFTADAYPLRNNPISKFLLSAWHRFDRILTQDESSSRLLKLCGIDSVISGDPRADRVLQIAHESTPPSDLKNWKGDSKLVLAGSSWAEEEGALASLTWDAQIKLLIAPHEVNEANIQRILALFPNSSRYTSGDLNTSVVVIDSVGLLSSLYALADLAVIGGGFGLGLHNILEPSAFGIPSLSGPNTSRFREAISLQDVSALYISSTPSDLSHQVKRLLSSENSQELKTSGLAAKSWVLSQKGAAEKITSYLP